jgi:serine phosphatase RsbU (regulator of sigma subunit)
MKKAERIFGIIATSLLILGILLVKLHWPGAAVMMTGALLLFDFGYLPLQLIYQWRKSETKLQRFYSIFRFIAFFIILSSFLFKMMHWPGSNIGLSAATFLLPGYIILYFVLRMLKQGSLPFMLNDLLITIIGYGIYLFMTSTMVSPQVAMGYVGLENKYRRMNSGLETSNNLIYQSLNSITSIEDKNLLISIQELQKLGAQFYHTTDSLKEGFYIELYGPIYAERKFRRYMPAGLAASEDPGSHYFMVKGNGKLIKNSLEQYRQGIARIAEKHHVQSGLIRMGLRTRDFPNRWGDTISWEAQMFDRASTGLVLVNLSWMKQMVLLTEANVLDGLISQIDLSSEVKLLQELASKESERAIMLKENEIVRVKQQQELQSIQLEQSQDEVKQGRIIAIFAFMGIAFVIILLIISTRAYLLKQKDNKILAKQKEDIQDKNDELNQQNEEIAAQRDEIEAQRNLVSMQKEQIQQTHNEISASIDYATRLQASIMPSQDLLKEVFSDHFILFRPRDKVSGDFYWWSQIENQIIIAAADCTGHGVPGAFMSMLGISLLSEVVNKEFITNPGQILDQLRREVIRSLNQTGEKGEQKDGLDISLVNINTETWTCHYSGANNPIYLIRNHELTEYKSDMMPISIYHRMDSFTSHEIQLEPGDKLYLFSDGYADQFGGKNRKKFKYKAFKQLLIDHTDESMDQQNKILTDTIVRWQGDHEQIDDMVVVGLKV